MPSHVLVLSALHALTLRRMPTTGRALVTATALDRHEVLRVVRRLERQGLVRLLRAEARLTLEGFTVATSIAARKARRGQLHVLPLASRAPLRHAA